MVALAASAMLVLVRSAWSQASFASFHLPSPWLSRVVTPWTWTVLSVAIAVALVWLGERVASDRRRLALHGAAALLAVASLVVTTAGLWLPIRMRLTEIR